MMESLRRRETIKRAFEEMQGAYLAAFSSEPADEEKNAWANKKINALETISEAIVLLTAGDAWTRGEERAVNNLNEYVASIYPAYWRKVILVLQQGGINPEECHG